MPWAAMRFLMEALRRQRRRLKLETLILLAVRCLVLLFIGAAIARPMLEKAGLLGIGGGGRDVYILIDNGLASSARDAKNAAAIERHRAAADAVIDSLGPGDRVGLVSLASPADLSVVPSSGDLHAVRALVDELQPTDGATDLPGAIERLGGRLAALQSAGADPRPVVLVVLSDFCDGSADLGRPLPASLAGVKNLSIIASRPGEPADVNVQITAAEPLRAVMISGSGSGGASGAGGGRSGGESQQVRVQLKRSGSGVARAGVSTVRVRLIDPGENAAAGASGSGAQATVQWQPGQSEASATVQLDASSDAAASAAGGSGGRGQDAVLIAEIDRDSVSSDNLRRRTVEVRDRLHVGVVAQRVFGSAGRVDKLTPADWFRLAVRPGEESPLDVIDLEPSSLDTPTLALVDALVLPAPDQIPPEAWAKIRRFADGGGLVVVSPPENVTVHLWADAMLKALDLPWRIAREASVPAAKEKPATIAEPEQVAPGSAASDGSTIFAMIGDELKRLVQPVSIFKWLGIEDTRAHARPLLKLSTGQPWLLAARVGSIESKPGEAIVRQGSGRGLVVLLASAPALSWTDLPARPLMLPLVQEMIRQGLGESGGFAGAIAGHTLAVPPGTTELRPLSAGDGGSNRAAARDAIRITDSGITALPIRSAGIWRAIDASGRARGVVAVNADCDAGRLVLQAPDAVASWLAAAAGGTTGASGEIFSWLDSARPTAAAQGGSSGSSPLTLPLLAAGLLFVLVELVLARYFSHAFVEPAGASGGTAGSADSLTPEAA